MTLSLNMKELQYLKSLFETRVCDLNNMVRNCDYTSVKEELETNLGVLGKVKNKLKENEPVTISREDADKIMVLLGYAIVYGEYALNEKERLIKLLRNEND